MDPIELILNALSVDETPNVPVEFAEDQIKYARQRLVSLLANRLQGLPDARAMIDRYLEAPDVWEGPLVNALQEDGVDKDPEVIEAAREVLRYAQPLAPREAREEEPEAEEPPSTIPGIIEDTEETGAE
jgi:hypothetical protein